jgi:periplasmic protein CpxP/Spy
LLRLVAVALLNALLIPSPASGQQQGNAPPPDGMGPPPMAGRRSPMERAFHAGPPGRWWNNPDLAQKLGLTEDQQKQMESVFEQNRSGLLDLLAAVRKEEAEMEPLLMADHLDDSRILAQIDRVTQARADLERANGRMLLSMRKVLSSQQWKTLQSFEPYGHHHFGGGPPPGPGGPPY